MAYSQLPVWKRKIDLAIEGKTEVSSKSNPLSPTYAGSIKYVDVIEKKHPNYLLELFRYAQKTIGSKASYAELADVMNKKSGVEEEERDILSLHPLQVY